MPCSDTHFTPILDELRAREDADLQTQQQSALNPGQSAAKSRRGGARPGAGPPKGNLNALKHGRTSKRQARLLESLVEIPEVRDTLIAMAARNRKRRKRAETEINALLGDLLTRLGAAVLFNEACPDRSGGNDQTKNHQILTGIAKLQTLLEPENPK